MNETKNIEKARSEPESKELYLPAMSAEPRSDRVEQVVSDLFSFHGVVLIPDSYNK